MKRHKELWNLDIYSEKSQLYEYFAELDAGWGSGCVTVQYHLADRAQTVPDNLCFPGRATEARNSRVFSVRPVARYISRT